MSLIPSLSRKIYTADTIAEQVNNWHKSETIVFTNGCFDILHLGHVDYLNRSAQLASKLVVGLNTDVSVRKLSDNAVANSVPRPANPTRNTA